ncbi:class I mannose-6-phosphate isomerase [Mycoplasma marinum]|uniref:class I mannose-6-phosphate isomerase n=1 Tax=Mycoplasma marinum TaxID=1937190 RepID=UPI003B379B9E
MIKVIPIRVEKIWGYEIWLHSTYKKKPTKTENDVETTKGPLIKIIKANRPLSVQVHPDDMLAQELEGQPNGKSECWYILEANKDTEFIVGIKTTDGKKIRESLKNGTFFRQLDIYIPKVGDFINVPAGLVHGIGGGSKVMEVQQPSDTTYRFYDYGRLENGKPRELHIEKSIKSIKQLEWKQESSTQDFKTQKCETYQVEIHKTDFFAPKDSIVIDLELENAYISEGEQIKFKHYAIVTY